MTRARNPRRHATYWLSGLPARAVEPDPPESAVDGAPGRPAPASRGPDELRYGYTLADVHEITLAALAGDRLIAMPFAERRDIAWSAIVEHLYSAEDPPHRQRLVRVGWQAIYRTIRDTRRQRGYRDGYDDFTSPVPTRPRFLMYWSSTVVPSHEDRVVDSIATRQVLAALRNPTYRDAVLALAAHDDYMLAAQALGISYKALVFRIRHARRQFLARWHEGETPHLPRRTDRRVESHSQEPATHCGRGHEWTPENTRTRYRTVRGKAKRDRVCRACGRDRDAARRRPVNYDAPCNPQTSPPTDAPAEGIDLGSRLPMRSASARPGGRTSG